MNIYQKIKEVEKGFAVEEVKIKNLMVWSAIRHYFFYSILYGKNIDNLRTTKGGKKRDNIKYLSSLFYGFFNWFKRYDYWMISSSSYRREIKGEFMDVFVDYPAEILQKSLIIETPNYSHFKRSNVHSSHIVSRSLLIVCEQLYAIILPFFYRLKGREVVDKIFSQYDIQFNYRKKAFVMYAQYAIMRSLLRLKKKPKAVFITVSYTYTGYIKAFNEAGIKVIEIQHGQISKDHAGYNVLFPLPKSYIPEILLTFGKNESKIFENPENYMFSSDEVIPVGHFYLEWIKNNRKKSATLEREIKKYNITVVASLQDDQIGDQLVPFLTKVAAKLQNCLFILKPRNKTSEIYKESIDIPINVVFEETIDIYSLLLYADVHTTIYSTCAIEAPALGVGNVLVDIEGKAKATFNELLPEETTWYVDSVDDYLSAIKNFDVVDKTIIKAKGTQLIVPGYYENIQQFISKELM